MSFMKTLLALAFIQVGCKTSSNNDSSGNPGPLDCAAQMTEEICRKYRECNWNAGTTKCERMPASACDNLNRDDCGKNAACSYVDDRVCIPAPTPAPGTPIPPPPGGTGTPTPGTQDLCAGLNYSQCGQFINAFQGNSPCQLNGNQCAARPGVTPLTCNRIPGNWCNIPGCVLQGWACVDAASATPGGTGGVATPAPGTSNCTLGNGNQNYCASLGCYYNTSTGACSPTPTSNTACLNMGRVQCLLNSSSCAWSGSIVNGRCYPK